MRTKEQIEAMSDEERRIKTAELCGWTVLELEVRSAITYEWAYPPKVKSGDRSIIPDYINSLDAMHEAEKVLDPREEFSAYSNALILDVCANPQSPRPLCATARQRNTAFLMTMMEDTP